MNDEGRRCALPGCDVEIQIAHGRPERRYCTAAHRAAARKARRAAMHTQQRSEPAADMAVMLPWLRPVEPTGDRSVEPGARVPEAVPTGPVLRPVLHHPAERAVTAAEAGVVARGAARRSRDGRPEATRPRGRRAVAVLGAAGILAGGYAVVPRPAPPVPMQAADGETTDVWAQRAAIALAAVNRQLDTLAQTEEQWRQLPESRSGVVPAPVTALAERRAVLQRRRAALQSQLDAYRSLRETQQGLAESEQHLRAVEKALAEVPQPRSSAAQEAAVAALDEQRDLQIRRRDAQRAELRNLESRVVTAARTPLPDDSAATAEVNRDVLEVIRNGGRTPKPDDPALPRPDAVDGREQDGGGTPSRAGTSGPPDPRGPGGESAERRPGATTQQAGPPDPGDTLTQLQERAREVAREAQRAGSARTAGQRTPDVPRHPDAHTDTPVPGSPAGRPPTDPHDAAASVPQGDAAAPAPQGDAAGAPAPHGDAARGDVAPASKPPEIEAAPSRGAVVHQGTHQDDDAIEEQNAARSSGPQRRSGVERNRSTGRHTTSSAASGTGDAHRAEEADMSARRAASDGSTRSGESRTSGDPRTAEVPKRSDDSPKSGESTGSGGKSGGSARSGSPARSGSERSGSDHRARSAHRARSDASWRAGHASDDYLRFSRALVGGGSSGR